MYRATRSEMCRQCFEMFLVRADADALLPSWMRPLGVLSFQQREGNPAPPIPTRLTDRQFLPSRPRLRRLKHSEKNRTHAGCKPLLSSTQAAMAAPRGKSLLCVCRYQEIA